MSTNATKVSRTVALDKEVAKSASAEAKRQNRSFSNYVETLLAEAREEAKRKPSTK